MVHPSKVIHQCVPHHARFYLMWEVIHRECQEQMRHIGHIEGRQYDGSVAAHIWTDTLVKHCLPSGSHLSVMGVRLRLGTIKLWTTTIRWHMVEQEPEWQIRSVIDMTVTIITVCWNMLFLYKFCLCFRYRGIIYLVLEESWHLITVTVCSLFQTT